MRLKDISQLTPQYKGQPIDGEVSFVPMESLRNGSIDLKEISYSEAKGKYTFFRNGDLLVAKVPPCFENGNIAIAENLKEGIGFGSSEIFVLRMNEKVLNKYMFYLTQTSHFQDAACATMCGVGGLKRISPLFMRTYELELPSIDRQKRVVSYLDEKTATIDSNIGVLESKRDSFINLKASLIQTVVTKGLNKECAFKDSGIDYMGAIPCHWGMGRLKENCEELESGKRPVEDAEEILSIGGEHIQNGTFYLEHEMFVSNKTYNDSKGKIRLGDILVVKDGATIGKCMYVSSMPKEKMLLNEHVYRIKANKYYYYAIASRDSQYWFRSRNVSSAQESIKQVTMLNLPVAIPPVIEQKEIADYLDVKCAEIDKSIDCLSKQIEASNRLRRALINEVITGKRAV